MPTPQIATRENWILRCDCLPGDVPAALVLELFARLRVIADELDTIDEASAVWGIVRAGELHLAVSDWRFAYRVPHRGLLAVVGAHRIPPREPA